MTSNIHKDTKYAISYKSAGLPLDETKLIY